MSLLVAAEYGDAAGLQALLLVEPGTDVNQRDDVSIILVCHSIVNYFRIIPPPPHTHTPPS